MKNCMANHTGMKNAARTSAMAQLPLIKQTLGERAQRTQPERTLYQRSSEPTRRPLTVPECRIRSSERRRRGRSPERGEAPQKNEEQSHARPRANESRSGERCRFSAAARKPSRPGSYPAATSVSASCALRIHARLFKAKRRSRANQEPAAWPRWRISHRWMAARARSTRTRSCSFAVDPLTRSPPDARSGLRSLRVPAPDPACLERNP